MDEIDKNKDRILQAMLFNSMVINSFIHDFKHKLHYLNMTAIHIQREFNSKFTNEEKLNQRLDSLLRNIEDINHSFDNFSQLSRPRRDAELVQTNLEHVVRQAVGFFLGLLKDRKIRIEIDNEIRGGQIKTSPNVLNQVLVVIIQNCINSFGSIIRKPEIRIKITSKNEIIVIDNGIGINDTNIDKIFEPGFSTFPYKAGFGLYFSKILIEDLLKGKLLIESKVNTGTKVIIQLNS